MIRWMALSAALALAACSGNASGLPSTSGATRPGSNATRTNLSIHIPKRVRVRHGRGVRYVSPSTVSASIVIDPAAGCAGCSPQISNVVGLTPDSPNCASAAGGTTCTFALVLAPGTYTGTIATYDGPPGCAPSCHTLSANQGFPLPIVAGKANTPTLTLYGVPAGLTLVPATSNGYTLATDFFVGGFGEKATALLYSVDADGSFIVGPGAPTFSIPSQPGDGWAASVSGNVLHVTTPRTFTQGGTNLGITLATPSCQLPGTTCHYVEDLLFSQLIAVADPAVNSVRIYRAHTQEPQTYALVTNGIDNPVDMLFDQSGNLFVANQGSGTVTKYAPPYTGAPTATIATGLSTLTKLAYCDLCGNLAVIDGGTRSVDVYLAPSFTAPPVVFGYASTPTALSFDNNGTLWIGKPGTVAGYANGYTSPASPVLSVGNPSAIRFTFSGNLFVADATAGTIAQYPAPGYSESSSVSGLNTPSSLFDFSGTLYVCSIGQSAGYSTSPLALFAITAEVGGTSRPCLLALDTYGGVWTYDSDGFIDSTAQLYGLNISKTVTAIAVFPAAGPLD